jgi:hypothetical protein
MFMTLGILLPILFHAVGLGSIFLPMFWPLAMAGFFLPVPFALAAGALTPFISSLSTGMPPAPTLYKMIFELAFLAGAVSFFYRKTRLGLFWPVLLGMLGAIVMGLLGSAALAALVDIPPRLYAIVNVGKGLPGIVCVLIMIPYLTYRLKQEPVFASRKQHVQGP